MPTKIEWCEESWNPVTGCSPVSEGCEHCYARRMAQRLRGRYGYPQDDPFRVTFHPDRLNKPLKWKKPRMIFVCSMGDLWHKDIDWPIIDKIFWSMCGAPQHTYLILTKRIEAAWYYFHSPIYKQPNLSRATLLTDNVWLGVTAENQPRFDERWSILAQIPAAKRFVSIEPMLGPVDLSEWLWQQCTVCWGPGEDDWGYDVEPREDGLDWIISGGESGPGARPMHPDWVRSVRDQCQEVEVPFFFKQWGEWSPHLKRFGGGIFLKPDGTMTCQGDYWDGQAAAMNRVGKKAAGRLLDGREWNEKP